MASNLYLVIAGVEGESTIAGIEDGAQPMEVLSFSYSCFQPVSEARSGSIHTSGRTNHGTVNFSKYTDNASSDICNAMWTGKTFATATLFAFVNDGKTVINYLKITLSNVVFTNYSIHCGGNSISGEEISMTFSKIQFDYLPQKQAGEANGNRSASWDLATEERPE